MGGKAHGVFGTHCDILGDKVTAWEGRRHFGRNPNHADAPRNLVKMKLVKENFNTNNAHVGALRLRSHFIIENQNKK